MSSERGGRSANWINRARLILALAMGYAPGFLVPFLVAHTSSKDSSDLLLLTVSVTTTSATIVSQTLEVVWSMWAVKNRGKFGFGDLPPRMAVLPSAGFTLLFLPTIIALYAAAGPFDKTAIALAALAAIPYAVLAGSNGFLSGLLIAGGNLRVSLSTQSLRWLLPILYVLMANPSPSAFFGLMAAGEALRLLIMRGIASRSLAESEAETIRLPALRELASVGTGMVVISAVPLIDRAFLATFEAGTITAFEQADRVFFAANQLCVTLLVLNRIQGWTDGGMQRAEAKREIYFAGAWASVAAVSICMSLVLVEVAGIGDRLNLEPSLQWAAILMVGLPFGVVGIVLSKMIVLGGQGNKMPALSAVAVGTNVLLNLTGAVIAGPVGVVAATPAQRVLMAACSLFVVRRGWRSRENG